MRQYRVWRDDSGGFIALDVEHPFCDILANPIFIGTEEDVWSIMPGRNGRYVAFLRARGNVRVSRQQSLPIWSAS